MVEYSDTVMDHFMNPRNVGEIENPDGRGKVTSPSCGDIMELYLSVDEDETITDAKFKTFGCGAAIASSSIATELIKGKPIDEALELSKEAITEELGGLPTSKVHCSVLAVEALKNAIDDYRSKETASV